MTIRTKRRGRTLAAILAAMLMASVLSVVAGGPAQAANTSGEHLIDTNGDGVPDSRQFAGSHRYLTAQYLADAYAENAGSPSTVIIASGESMVDAVTASGLAGNLDAPILLTRSDRLPHNVARYIDNHNVSHVVVVGGTAAVSDAVVTAIEALGSGPSTERVSGPDRYETATAIGSRLGGPNPTWCGSEQTAAILVNGGDSGRADAIAVGPIAFGLGLPVLLTAADELPQSTIDFLTDNAVEHVVIVGGTGAVSDSIREAMIEDVGVITVRRISGGDASGTSVELAEEMLDKCADVIGATPDMVALVNRDATADGVAAGPAMGYGMGNGAVPVLLVGDELPAAVSDYLSSTAESRGGLKTHLRIVAIGGTAVVSDSVMSAAVAAAKTSPALTAAISFDVLTPTQFTVTYSDNVKLPVNQDGNIIFLGDDTNLTSELADDTVLDPTLYRVNSRRIEGLLADAVDAVVPETELALEQIHVQDRTVTITLSHELKDGDVISVVGGPKIGAAEDKRPLEAASHTVSRAAAAADRSAPTVEIIGVAGGTTVSVFVVETKPLLETGTADIYIADGGVTLTLKTDGAESVLDLGAPEAAPMRPDPNAPAMSLYRYNVTVDAPLAKGDVIEVARNTFLDKGNRGNRLTRLTVGDVEKLEIDSVSIGTPSPVAGTAATVNISDAEDEDRMTVTAKQTGAAKGASGNGWKIYGYADPDAATAPLPASANISVEVDMRHRIIAYTVNKNGRGANSPTLFELARALVSNEQFAANFTVSFINPADQDKSDAVGAIDAGGLLLDGGQSQVAVRVQFNDVAAEVAAATEDTTIQLAEALAGGEPTDVDGVDSYTVTQLFAAPDDEVNFTYTTCTAASCSLLNLPQRGGTRTVAAGVATNAYDDGEDATTDDEMSKPIILRSLRPDSKLKPFADPIG